MTRKPLAWLILTAAAALVLLAWVFPDAIEHRGQIHNVSTEVVLCAGEHHSGRAQILQLADCAGDNSEVRRELRDELSALALTALAITGLWHVLHDA